MLGMLQGDRYWPAFCRALACEDIEKDCRFENMEKRAQNCRELIPILDELFATKTRDESFNIFEKEDLIYDCVQDHEDGVNDVQAWVNGYFVEFEHPTIGRVKELGVPFELTKTPGDARHPDPEFGQHTEEVLLEVGGYTWDEVAVLREEEVI
jgi:crotonobetainyl-CoA:carnitine CoA-transferase CaiB-like acyl-CoA transferase